MKKEALKQLVISSLSEETDTSGLPGKIEEAGLAYGFSPGFRDKVLAKIESSGSALIRELELSRTWNRAFIRIALSGVAAIVILLISIYISEGSFSINSMLGLSDSIDENIVSLLTNN
jgi:hypothetical protein